MAKKENQDVEPGEQMELIDKVWDTARKCPQHTFQILTKRIERVPDFLYQCYGKNYESFPNIHLGATICNQPEADRIIPILLQIPAAVHYVSIEPMLEGISLTEIDTGNKWPFKSEISKLNALIGGTYSRRESNPIDTASRFMDTDTPRLDWVIVGAESGNNRRECKIEWVESIVDQCKAAGVSCFVKQIHKDGKLVKMPPNYPQEYPND